MLVIISFSAVPSVLATPWSLGVTRGFQQGLHHQYLQRARRQAPEQMPLCSWALSGEEALAPHQLFMYSGCFSELSEIVDCVTEHVAGTVRSRRFCSSEHLREGGRLGGASFCLVQALDSDLIFLWSVPTVSPSTKDLINRNILLLGSSIHLFIDSANIY